MLRYTYIACLVEIVTGQFSFQGLNLVYGGGREILGLRFGHWGVFKVRRRKMVLWEHTSYLPDW
jgi:hypothetical protein